MLTSSFLFLNFCCIFIDYSPCGVSPIDFRARMVGGKKSKRGWWPWQIALYRTNDGGKLKSDVVFVCGEYGTMTSYINARIVPNANSSFFHINYKTIFL